MDTEAEDQTVEPMIVDELSDDAEEEIVYKQGSSMMESGKENALAPSQIPAISDDIRADYTVLNSDRRILDRLRNLNRKLISELAGTKLSEERYIKDYENEREQCEILQKKCDKLEELLACSETKLDQSVTKSEELCEMVDSLDSEVCAQRGEMYAKLDNVQETLLNKCIELETLCRQLEAFLRKNCGGAQPTEAVSEAEVLVQEVNEVNEANETMKIWEDHQMIMKKLPPVRTQAYSEDDSSDFDT